MFLNNCSKNVFKSIKGVIFDMDGTLTTPGCINFKRMREKAGIPKGVDIFPYVMNQMTGPAQENAIRVVLEEEEIGVQSSQLQKDTNNLITFLNNQGIKVGILTRNSKEVVDRIMPMFSGQIDTVISREFQPSKPNPDPILYINKLWNTDLSNLLLVGDCIDDIIPSLYTHSYSCFVNSHFSGEEQDCKLLLSKCQQKPNYILEELKSTSFFCPHITVSNISELYQEWISSFQQ
ncbi:hypothetical protein WA158_003103 [Blastocystis sp. Blastoise]